MNSTSQNIQIVHCPDGTEVGLITDGRTYHWPTQDIPAIIQALKKCAASRKDVPPSAKNRVFSSGGYIYLTDESGTASFENIAGEAAMAVTFDTGAYRISAKEAKRIAKALYEVAKLANRVLEKSK